MSGRFTRNFWLKSFSAQLNYIRRQLWRKWRSLYSKEAGLVGDIWEDETRAPLARHASYYRWVLNLLCGRRPAENVTHTRDRRKNDR